MIISRKYVPFAVLYVRDERAKEILEQAYSNIQGSKAEKERQWDFMCSNEISVDNADMGACIPNFGYIKKEFERLDSEFPYDNGFSVSDINSVEVIERSDDTIQLQLKKCSYGKEYIIGFATLNKENILSNKQ